jgi:hypothetical protein
LKEGMLMNVFGSVKIAIAEGFKMIDFDRKAHPQNKSILKF